MARKSKKAAKGRLSTAQKVGVGVGLTAAAAAAVGGYFLYGSKHAKQNRAKAKSWMLKAKAEVLEGLEKAQRMSKAEYEDMVDRVVKGYAKARKVGAKEATQYARELKRHWREIEKTAAKKVSKKRSSSRKPAKKASVKKSAKRKRGR